MVHVALNRSVGAVNELLVESKLEYLQLSDSKIKAISRIFEDENLKMMQSFR